MAKNTEVAQMKFPDIAIQAPRLLLPKASVDPQKWCVIACDQYTSDPKYWKEVEDFVGGDPSTLDLIFPEVHLGQGKDQEIIDKIRKNMEKYAADGILEEREPGFALIDRKTPVVESRKGLLVEIDLDQYTFQREERSKALVWPTEATIESRLPPRIAIRQGAGVELPHIMVLIDDPDDTVIGPLVKLRDEGKLPQLYDFDLMRNSGHLKAHHVKDENSMNGVAEALRKLANPQAFQKRFNVDKDAGVLLYPVGDGNHSLATAKKCWEKLKSEGVPDDHPARFALVELVNIHDKGLEFEPIHRLLLNVDQQDLMRDLREHCSSEGLTLKEEPGCRLVPGRGPADAHHLEFRFHGGEHVLCTITDSKFVLAHATLTKWLDAYLAQHKSVEVDYVHGVEIIDESCSKSPNTVGIVCPGMSKGDLCRTVVSEGVLPRKTFSMGEADEKRFYFEARRILPSLKRPLSAC